MKIAICDDEKQICELLKEKIIQVFFNNDESFEIELFENGEVLLKTDLKQIDILFLDVDMPGRNGLEIAKEIRRQSEDMIIIFITAYSEFVFESFKVEAFRYLLKPIKENELVETLQSVHKKLCESDEELKICFENETYNIKYSDILYLEGMRGKIWIYCKNGRIYRWRGVLKKVGESIKEKGFFQIHQSYIINMNKIVKYNAQMVELEEGHKVPISRYRLNDFKEEYIRFWSKIL